MFDDLNDPFPPSSGAEARQGVTARAGRLRRNRLLLGGGCAAALVGVAAFVITQSGGGPQTDRLIPAVTSAPSVEATATALPKPSASPTAPSASPTGEPTVTPTSVATATTTPTASALPTVGPSSSSSSSPSPAAYVWPPNPHAPQYFAAEDCSVSPMEGAGPAAFAGGELVTRLVNGSSAAYGHQSGAELSLLNRSGAEQHVLAVSTNLWALIDDQGHQVAHLARWYDQYERYTIGAGVSRLVSPMALWPGDCPGAQPQKIAAGSYTLLGGLRVVRADGSVSVWWAKGVRVTITGGPTASPTPTS